MARDDLDVLTRPRTLLYDATALADAHRTALAGRPLEGLAELRAEADAAVGATPVTVTGKTVPPPSGDPHDYVSLSIYRWPDPTTPDGLPYVKRDGDVNPEAADTRRYDVARLNRMVASVETLALAAHLTAERAYADAAATWLRTWFLDDRTRTTPSLRYAQIGPGEDEVRGSGIIESRQLMRAVDAALLLEGDPSWTATDAAALRAWFGQLVDWLTTSAQGKLERDAKGDHGTWYDAQVAAFALYALREPVAREALARAARRVATQVELDGRQPYELARTRSFHYSAFNVLALAVAADLGRIVGIDVWRTCESGIRAALDLLLRYADGGDPWPYSEIGRIDPLAELGPILVRASRAYPEAGYGRMLQRLAAKADPLTSLLLRLNAFGALGGVAVAPAPLGRS